MIELPFDMPNADKILKENFDAYLDSDDFRKLIGVKKVEQKSLITKLEERVESCYSGIDNLRREPSKLEAYKILKSRLNLYEEIIPLAKDQKQMLIDEIKKEIDNCMRAKARAKYVDTRDGFKQRIFAYDRCLELIEGIL